MFHQVYHWVVLLSSLNQFETERHETGLKIEQFKSLLNIYNSGPTCIRKSLSSDDDPGWIQEAADTFLNTKDTVTVQMENKLMGD